HSLAFPPDGRTLVLGGRNILWVVEVATRQERCEVWNRDSLPRVPGLMLASESYPGRRTFALSPDGRVAAATDDRGVVRLFGLDTGGEIARLTGHRGPVESLAF